MGCASLLLRGSFEYRFSISVNKMSLLAFMAKATKAESVSLSPYLSSSFATVSFH